MAGASPFLPSDPKDFPRLARVDVLDAAKAEFHQQLEHSSIELPVDRYRANGKLRQWKPSPGCPHAFKCAYSAFCSARRTMCACTTSEGELLFSSETAELLAHAQQLRPPFGSLLPRPLAVSLVVPPDARRSSSSLAFIDGIATLSETKTESGLPATTCVRYSIYGGEATASIERALAHDAFDRRSVQELPLDGIKAGQLAVSAHSLYSLAYPLEHSLFVLLDSRFVGNCAFLRAGVCLVARWVERDTVRTECVLLDSVSATAAETLSVLQTALVKISIAFSIRPPEVVFRAPPVAKECCFEMQVARCSYELRSMLRADGHVPDGVEELRLVRVPGCFLRLSPIALGLSGVMSPSNIHALLLCEEGFEKQASEFARRFREGLPPPQGGDAAMKLHSVAVHTERLDLNGMVSLYAPGGRHGFPIKKDGNWVYKHTASVVPLESLFGKFFVLSCDLESAMPSNSAFGKFMHKNIQQSLDLLEKLFPRPGAWRLGEDPLAGMLADNASAQQRFEMAAMGIDIGCKRMAIGDALSYLTSMGESGGLFDMLMAAAERVGLRASLDEAFQDCAAVFKASVAKQEAAKELVCKLKRVADAALLVQCSKRARTSQPTASADKVRLLFKSLGLKAGRQSCKLKDFVTTPRCVHSCHSAWSIVCECIDIDTTCGVAEAAQRAMQSGCSFVSSLAVAMWSAACFKNVKKRTFVIIHGHYTIGPSVSEVTGSGELQPATTGVIFDALSPSVVLMKLLSDRSCLLTAMVSRG